MHKETFSLIFKPQEYWGIIQKNYFDFDTNIFKVIIIFLYCLNICRKIEIKFVSILFILSQIFK